MTQKYYKACIKYSDGAEEPIDALNYRVEVIEKDIDIFRYDYEWTTRPEPPLRLSYINSHGAKVEIELPPDAGIWKTCIEGDIWWLEIKGFRSSDYYDNLEAAIANQKEDEDIKGGFITTTNPNK